MESDNAPKIKLFIRELFTKNNLSGGLENFVAVFPAIILMPIVINASAGFEIFNIATVLFTSAVSSILYLIITRGRLPGYLGSSFAYIGSSIYIVNSLKDTVPQEEIADYLIGAYIVAALIFCALALISNIKKKNETPEQAKKRIDKLVDFFIPPAVLGPAISLIGLELSPTAAAQSGLSQGGAVAAVAGITLFSVVFLTVTKRNILKNSSLVIALVIGGIIASSFRIWDFDAVKTASAFITPSFRFRLPKFTVSTVFLIIPPTLILFCEHIGRKIIIENLKLSLEKTSINSSLSNSLLANGIGNLSSALLSGVPTTIYAESTGVMRINENVKPHQYVCTAAVLIACSLSGHLLALIKGMPDPVIGAISLFLMAIIAAPGLRVLVDRKVNYDKISNLLLTASVLVVGLSKMSIVIGNTTLNGMSLGLLVGIAMNLFFVGLRKIRLLKEHLSADEIISLLEKIGAKKDTLKGTKDARVFAYVNDAKYFELSNSILGVEIWILTNVCDADCKKRFKVNKDIENNSIRFRIDNNITEKDAEDLILASRQIAAEESKRKIKDSLYSRGANYLLDFEFEHNPSNLDALKMLLRLPETNILGLIIQDSSKETAQKVLDVCLCNKSRRINLYTGDKKIKDMFDENGFYCELSDNLSKVYTDACKTLLGKLNIIIAGALTNLARAINSREKNLLFDNLFVIAGDFRTFKAEINCESDVQSAEFVLESEFPNLMCFSNHDGAGSPSPTVKAVIESLLPHTVAFETKRINVISSGEATGRVIAADDGKELKIASDIKPELYENLKEFIDDLTG